MPLYIKLWKGRIKLYILTDGKNYVMENPMKIGDYLATTSPIQAKEFTYKQARSLVQKGGKKYSWIRNYQLVSTSDNENELKNSLYYKGNAGVYMDDSTFDDKVLVDILAETKSILGLAGWEVDQLTTYKNMLSMELSRCDSAESDIEHALQTYKEKSGGKKPQAHKMAKVGYMLDEIRDRHKKIKQCMNYIDVMLAAHKYKYTIEKLKLELSRAEHKEYKGRTKYYQKALDLLN